jgi:hypothetical protein
MGLSAGGSVGTPGDDDHVVGMQSLKMMGAERGVVVDEVMGCKIL